jgi:hypothetical protein
MSRVSWLKPVLQPVVPQVVAAPVVSSYVQSVVAQPVVAQPVVSSYLSSSVVAQPVLGLGAGFGYGSQALIGGVGQNVVVAPVTARRFKQVIRQRSGLFGGSRTVFKQRIR